MLVRSKILEGYMAQITAKELGSLSDLMSVEENLAAKYKTYASITQDAELRAKYEQISDTHKKHYDALLANLK